MSRGMIIAMVLLAACGGGEKKEGGGKQRDIPKNAGRATAQVCPAERAPGKISEGTPGECKADGDCTKGKNGRCLTMGSRDRENKCTYDACLADADCGSGPCDCNTYGNRCLAGNCKVNADCGAEGHCMPSGDMGCNGSTLEYHCVTPGDTCTPFGDDCGQNHQCIYSDELKHFTCAEEPKCPVG